MEYTTFTLFMLGIFGILIHILIKVKSINDKTVGNFHFGTFIKLEWPSVLISICVIVVCLLAKYEIKKLDMVGDYLGLGFVFAGYSGQSLVYHVLGRAEKRLNKEEPQKVDLEKITKPE